MLAENVAKLRDFLAGKEVRIVPATKTVSAEVINLLPSLGIVEAGENRVQEFLGKYGEVKGINWHFIGRLQTNKVKYIAGKVSMIQSLDRAELADEIEKRCAAAGKVMDCLIEVNAGGEASKGGVAVAELPRLVGYVVSKPHLCLRGLMSVLPIGAGEGLYDKMYGLSERLKAEFPRAGLLSMGMSGDYITAVRHGANMIRPGSLLFGERDYGVKEVKGV